VGGIALYPNLPDTSGVTAQWSQVSSAYVTAAATVKAADTSANASNATGTGAVHDASSNVMADAELVTGTNAAGDVVAQIGTNTQGAGTGPFDPTIFDPDIFDTGAFGHAHIATSSIGVMPAAISGTGAAFDATAGTITFNAEVAVATAEAIVVRASLTAAAGYAQGRSA